MKDRKPPKADYGTYVENSINDDRYQEDGLFHRSIFEPKLCATFGITSIKADIIRYKMTYGNAIDDQTNQPMWKYRLRSWYESIEEGKKSKCHYIAIPIKLNSEEMIDIPFEGAPNETLETFALRIMRIFYGNYKKITKEQFDVMSQRLEDEKVKIKSGEVSVKGLIELLGDRDGQA